MEEKVDLPQCPLCGRRDTVLRIVTGEPTPEDLEEIRAGRAMLADILFSTEGQVYFCRSCGCYFTKAESGD